MAKLEIVFERDEIPENLAYEVICTTRETRVWDTGRRRRKWLQEFSEKERNASSRIFAQAHSWYLGKGLPDEVRMSVETLKLWHKLELFCATL